MYKIPKAIGAIVTLRGLREATYALRAVYCVSVERRRESDRRYERGDRYTVE
jgi:hypothetical protein